MYQVLARKWRPHNFEELVGQQHVARALRNAVESNRLAHAYNGNTHPTRPTKGEFAGFLGVENCPESVFLDLTKEKACTVSRLFFNKESEYVLGSHCKRVF